MDQASQPGKYPNFFSRVTITSSAHLPLSPGHHVAEAQTNSSGAEPYDALISAVICVARCTAPSIGPLCLLKSANLTLHLLQQRIMLACWGFGIAVVIGDCIHHAMHCILRQRQSSGRGARGIGLAGAMKFWASTAAGSSGSWKWPSPLGRSSEPRWHFNCSKQPCQQHTHHLRSRCLGQMP